MSLKWIIEHFHDDNRFDRLGKAAINQGIDCKIINTNEQSLDMRKMDHIHPLDTVLIQSSFQFRKEVLDFNKNVPTFKIGLPITEENYKCTNYYKYFGNYLFNSEYVIMTVSETCRQIDFLEKILGEKETGRIFIRPDSGMKSFSGMVFINRNPYFTQDWGYVKHNTSEDDLVIISSPKKILSEWRFVVIDGKVVTGSIYKMDYDVSLEPADPISDKHMFDFAQKMADKYQPNIAFTIDLAIGIKGEIGLLELNSFSCAGLYACDMDKIVEAVKKVYLTKI